jgi:predicted small lipoprotein YifL
MSDPMHYRMTATMRILTERRSASLSKVIAAGLLLMLPMIQGCGQTGALYLLTTPEGSDANNSNTPAESKNNSKNVNRSDKT